MSSANGRYPAANSQEPMVCIPEKRYLHLIEVESAFNRIEDARRCEIEVVNTSVPVRREPVWFPPTWWED